MNSTVAEPKAVIAEPTTEHRQDAWEKVRLQPPYNVVLLDDNDHTYEYVIEMLMSIFGYNPVKAFLMAREVDTAGRVIVLTTTLERAELERDRIHAYGADWRIPRCKGSMSAVLEPAG